MIRFWNQGCAVVSPYVEYFLVYNALENYAAKSVRCYADGQSSQADQVMFQLQLQLPFIMQLY